MLVKLTGRGTVTIPKDLRAGLPGGTVLDAIVRDDGVLELRPQAPDPSQAWFWSRRWQRMEREVDQSYAAGHYETFDDVDDFLSTLDEHAATAKGRRAGIRHA
jgi:bifunctional DNA-binding transcriptional regulator/antitoxin component of YhaV-PrlF toxin-antitoxin module